MGLLSRYQRAAISSRLRRYSYNADLLVWQMCHAVRLRTRRHPWLQNSAKWRTLLEQEKKAQLPLCFWRRDGTRARRGQKEQKSQRKRASSMAENGVRYNEKAPSVGEGNRTQNGEISNIMKIEKYRRRCDVDPDTRPERTTAVVAIKGAPPDLSGSGSWSGSCS